MLTKTPLLILVFLVSFASSCMVIQQDEIGIKRKFGKVKGKVSGAGLKVVNPLITEIVKLPIRTVNLEVTADLPSKEGLTINTEISILYHIIPSKATDILKDAGESYETTLILPVFRSAVADVSARFFAKDMHSSKRAEIEKEVQKHMHEILEKRGFIIEAVLMKTVRIPQGLTRAIEQKLQAEQDAQRMEFVLRQEKLEAERLKIQAEGQKEYQRIIRQELNKTTLRFMEIEAFRELARSSNAKVIITDGKSPMMLDVD